MANTNKTTEATWIYQASHVSNGRPRLQSDRLVAIQSPNGRKWELYIVDSDGLETFQRYATSDEARVLAAAVENAKERGFKRGVDSYGIVTVRVA